MESKYKPSENLCLAFVFLAVAAWLFLGTANMTFHPERGSVVAYLTQMALFIVQMAFAGHYIGKALEGLKP